MKTSWFKRCVLSIAMLALVAPVYAAVELEMTEFEDKAIHVETDETKPLRMSLEPIKASFAVNEPIRFRIRGNKTFFLYLYSIDKETGEATLVLPTKEGQKHNKYPAGQTLTVPNQGTGTFLADETGHEKLVMVASSEYLPIKSAWFRKGANHYVGKAEEFEAEFAEKGIQVQGPGKTRNDKVLVKTLAVRIQGERPTGDGVAQSSTVWLTTKGNRRQYAVGESIEALFGAERDGWLHLYVIEPDGRHTRLKSYEVKGNASYTMKATAEDPTGKHALVAVYTQDNQPTRMVAGLGDQSTTLLDVSRKGIRPDEEDAAAVPMAVYRFEISEN